MAAVEHNNVQEPYPTENGDAVTEEKNLSIDYSEDLWLASEESSGPYAQQPNKVVPASESVSKEDSAGGVYPVNHGEGLKDAQVDENWSARRSEEAETTSLQVS